MMTGIGFAELCETKIYNNDKIKSTYNLKL